MELLHHKKRVTGRVMAVNHFRPYLYGQEFRLRTDHALLLWLYKRTEPSHQVARWLESLAEFQFKLEHRAGAKHGNADDLSRCANCSQCTCIENRDGGPTREELAAGHSQVTAISAEGLPATNRNPFVGKKLHRKLFN